VAKSQFDEAAENILALFTTWPLDKPDTVTLLKVVYNLVESRLKPKKKKGPAGGPIVWKTYAEAYLERYKVTPLCNAAVLGMCSNLIRQAGLDNACALVRFFLTQNDAFYIRNSHKLSLLLTDYHKLHTMLATGQKISYKSAQSVENASNSAEATSAYLREKHTK
jgi:hypothetical protein